MSEANLVALFAGGLGDFLLALPALRLVRRRHAPRAFTLAVRGPLARLAGYAGCADRVARLDDADMARFLGGGPPPGWWPGRPRLYSWFGGGDPAVEARLRAHAALAEFPRVVRGDGDRHAALEYCAAIGASATHDELIALAAIGPAAAAAAGGAAGPLVVHRGAGAPAKRWSAAGFAEVVAWWRARGGAVVELLGPAEEGEPPLPGAEPLREAALPAVAELLAGARAFVGNDAGPSHLAAACGVRGVVLFGPTDPRRWRPLSTRLAVLRAALRTRGDAAPPAGDAFTEPPASAVIECLAGALP